VHFSRIHPYAVGAALDFNPSSRRHHQSQKCSQQQQQGDLQSVSEEKK